MSGEFGSDGGTVRPVVPVSSSVLFFWFVIVLVVRKRLFATLCARLQVQIDRGQWASIIRVGGGRGRHCRNV